MSDNELDDLFREAAEAFKPSQDSASWKEMSARLDRSIPKTGFWNRKTISVTAVTGILVVVAVWYAITEDSKEILKIKDNQISEKHGANNATQGVVQEQEEQSHQIGKENFEPTQPVENKNAENSSVNKSFSNHIYELRGNNSVVKGNSSDGKNTVNSILTESRPIEHIPDAATHADAYYDSSENIPFVVASKGNGSPAISNTTDQQQKLREDSISSALPIDSLERVVDEKEHKNGSISRSGVSIKAVISPDFSSVKFFTDSKRGINYGLLAGYSFNARWSLYTGVIFSRKLYVTKNVEGSYNWNGHNYPIKQLDGDCRILDIPINIYYTLFPDRSFSVRFGLGFSSYIMRKEDYVYRVDDYGTNVYYTQHVRGENNEWFKIMNVSVVASKRLTPRLSAEFEPFVKAPLAGVGEGKVSLVSMGAFVNLKYDLIIHK